MIFNVDCNSLNGSQHSCAFCSQAHQQTDGKAKRGAPKKKPFELGGRGSSQESEARSRQEKEKVHSKREGAAEGAVPGSNSAAAAALTGRWWVLLLS